MKIFPIIDSSCVLTKNEMDAMGSICIPHLIKIDGEQRYTDEFAQGEVIDIYESDFLYGDTEIIEQPLITSKLNDRLLSLATKEEISSALCLSSSKALGSIFYDFEAVINRMNTEARTIRHELGYERPLLFRALSSGNGGSGYTLAFHYICKLIAAGNTMPQVVTEWNNAVRKISTLTLIRDPAYTSIRIMASGTFGTPKNLLGALNSQFGSTLNISPIIKLTNDNISTQTQALGAEKSVRKLFSIVTNTIRKGLDYKVVVISYAGGINEFKQQDIYQKLLANTKEHDVDLLTRVMPLTEGITLGPEAISIGIMSKDIS